MDSLMILRVKIILLHGFQQQNSTNVAMFPPNSTLQRSKINQSEDCKDASWVAS